MRKQAENIAVFAASWTAVLVVAGATLGLIALTMIARFALYVIPFVAMIGLVKWLGWL